MFENLTYEKFKKTDTTKMTLENNQAFADALLKTKNDYLKGKEVKIADARVLNAKNQELRTEYDQKLNDKIARSNAANTLYRQMWANTRQIIEDDPTLKAYREKKHLTTLQALNHLANQYGLETALGKQLKSMERMVIALDGICELDQTKENFLIDQHAPNLINGFLTELNNTNGKTLGSSETKLSLSQEAYLQLESIDYKGVENDQDLLMAVHLGQICSDMVTQVTKIEIMAPLLHGEDEVAKNEEMKNDFESFVSEFPGNPEEFLSGKDKVLEDENKIVEDYNYFKTNKTTKTEELQTKYKDFLGSTIAQLSAEEIQAEYNEEIKKRQDKLTEVRKKENEKNDITRRQNEETKQRYEKDLFHNEKIYNAISEIETNKKKALEATDEEIRIKEEADNKYLKEREDQGKELEQKWRIYDEKLSEGQNQLKQMKNALEERKKLEAMVSKLAPKGTEMEELAATRRTAQIFTNILRAVEDSIEGDASISNAMGNAALRSEDLTEKDLRKASKDVKENIRKAMKIQKAWRDFKESHTEYSSYFHFVDDFKGKKAHSTEPGPMEALYEQYYIWQDKTRSLEKVVDPYLEARKKAEELSEQNGGHFVTEDEVLAKEKEVEQLEKNTPAEIRFDKKAWDKETKAGLGTGLNELKNKRLKQEKTFDEDIKSCRTQLKDASEPHYWKLTSEKEINQIVEDERKKLLGENVLKQLKADINRTVSAKKKDAAMNILEETLKSKAFNANTRITKIKDTEKKINDMFRADQTRMESKKNFTDGLKAQAAEFADKKNNFYTSISNDLSKYFSNMENGKKAGHQNSDEFKDMADSVRIASEVLNPQNNHTAAEQVDALLGIKRAAEFYQWKKEDDFHVKWLASSMRHVRLNMAKDLVHFAEEKLKQINDFEKVSSKMEKHLKTLEPKASVFDVKPGEADAATHFKRVFKAKQQEKLLKVSKENINEKAEEKKVIKDDVDQKKSNSASKLGNVNKKALTYSEW